MTRVLMTTDTVGGVWTYALELADALAPHGVEVVLATMGPPMSGAQRHAVDASAVADVRGRDVALEWMPEPWGDVDRAGAWLLELEAELRPDVVHLNGYAHAALPWRAPTVVVAHSCVLSWWEAVHGEPAGPEWHEYRRRVTEGLTAADAVVAPTAAMLAALHRCYGTSGGMVVPNCRHDASVAPAQKEPIVLAAGRLWDEAKDVAAVARLAGTVEGRVVIAGATDHPGGGQDWHAEGVDLLGPLPFDELASWMGRAAVYALPARYEPFGLSALEAALGGCALVLGDIPSLREVWGEDATFVEPGDDQALAGAVRRLLTDESRCSAMGARARRRAATYTPARTAAGYLDAYRRVAAVVGSAR